MNVRRAREKDLPKIVDLLNQVLTVHHKSRPDLFKGNCRKYTDEELLQMFQDENRPILVAVNEQDAVQGYAFCVIIQHPDDHILTDIKTLYIDDLCVDEKLRGAHVGKTIYEAVLQFAREIGCYNVTLNVWSCNESAKKFYEKMGLVPQKIGMETIL